MAGQHDLKSSFGERAYEFYVSLDTLPRKRELSSIYIYDMIRHMGGPAKFYSSFFSRPYVPLASLAKGEPQRP